MKNQSWTSQICSSSHGLNICFATLIKNLSANFHLSEIFFDKIWQNFQNESLIFLRKIKPSFAHCSKWYSTINLTLSSSIVNSPILLSYPLPYNKQSSNSQLKVVFKIILEKISAHFESNSYWNELETLPKLKVLI